MLVVSGHGASTELAATKPAVAPLPCQYTAEPAFPMAHPGGSSWLFPAWKKKQNSALQGGGGTAAVSESCGALGPTAVALGCFTFKKCICTPVPVASRRCSGGGFARASPPAEEGLWVWSSRNSVSPHCGACRPSCLEQHVGIQLGSPISCFLHGGEALPSLLASSSCRAAPSSSAELATLREG